MARSQASTQIEVDAQLGIGLRDIALMLGVSYNTVYKWTTDPTAPLKTSSVGEVGGAKGTLTRVTLSDLIDFKITKALLKDGGTKAGVSPEALEEIRQVKLDGERSKARRAHNLAIMSDMDLAERIGLLVPISIIEGVWEGDMATVRSGILGTANALAPRLAVASTTADCYDILQEYGLELLDKLSSGEEAATTVARAAIAVHLEEDEQDEAGDE